MPPFVEGSHLAGDEGGGMGEGVGRWRMEGGQGGEMGGAPESSVGGVGRWPMEGGQGGRWGGAPESNVGATKPLKT